MFSQCMKKLNECEKRLLARDQSSVKMKGIKETLNELLYLINDITHQPIRLYPSGTDKVLLDGDSELRFKQLPYSQLYEKGIVIERAIEPNHHVSILFRGKCVIPILKDFLKHETNVYFINK